MTDTQTDNTQPAAAEAPSVVVAQGEGPTIFNWQSKLLCIKQMPLPGVIIFVHGVNSEGEWYQPAEDGLCKGLNRRLGRLSDQMSHPGIEAGQLTPAQYTESLTPDGFLNPKLLADNYVKPVPSFSNVIPFRWGYRATLDELKEYGDKIFLNEQDYWGGGPFANGCSSLPDLWHQGVDDRIFGWITIQGMNPTNRPLYRTPPRAYGVLAALRLAKLIESIRKMQANVPITVVCHSQGNMVGLTAAFFGDALPEVEDPWGNKGRCVADAYVLANPPYSLANSEGKGVYKASTLIDTWSQRNVKDPKGNRGRETYAARTGTFAKFLDIIRARPAFELPADKVDDDMANTRESPTSHKSYTAQADRERHGLNGSTYGRVTLYCCPHDQVISAVTVQGIGWRGIGQTELEAIGAAGVLTQRVFASGFKVGIQKKYDYWKDDWRNTKNEKDGFWFPPSPPAKYTIVGALKGNETIHGSIGTFFTAVPATIVTFFTSRGGVMRVNADPEHGWFVMADAPTLDESFSPQALRFENPVEIHDGDLTSDFNEGNDPPSAWRNASKKDEDKRADDPYDQYKAKHSDGQAQGNAASETSQRYEDHAIVRMEARRTKNAAWVDDAGHVTGEDGTSELPKGYKDWRNKEVKDILDRGATNNPTNHSITMTNSKHAELALAYDVAIGPCYLTLEQMNTLRIEADWRMGKGISDDNPNKKYATYFSDGIQNNLPIHVWAVAEKSEGNIPTKIVDEREGQFYLSVGGGV